jgi:hypothetical protein
VRRHNRVQQRQYSDAALGKACCLGVTPALQRHCQLMQQCKPDWQ